MSNSTSHAALPYPIRNARFSLPLSFRVSAGTPTDPTTPDTEFSTDGGATFSDCAEEITTGGTNGLGYLTLTGAETNNNVLLIAGKSANCLETPAILYPRVLAVVGSGTLSAGSAGGGTLGTLLAYDVTGCFIRTTGGTGGGGTGGANNQARKIVTYNTSTGAFTVTPNWETTPSTDTTYDVLLPEGLTLGSLRALNPTTSGRTLDVSSGGEAGLDWANVGSPTTTLDLQNTTIKTTQKVDVETIKTNAVVNGGTLTFPTNATLASTTNITAGTVTAGTVSDKTGYALSSAGVQAIWDALTSALTTVGSIGKRIVDNLNATVSSRAATGDAMTLTTGERTAVANEVEAQIIDDTDSEKVLTAITDKIASVNPSLDDLTLASISSAIRTELATELARLDAAVSTRATPAQVNTEADTALADAGVTTTRTARLDANISSRAAAGDQMDLVNAPNATAITAIQSGLATAVAVAAVQADLPQRITKNNALANFPFMMVDATDLNTPETGLTVTAARSLDGAAFGSCANSVSEIGSGWYKIDLAAADLNGNTVALKFVAVGAATRNIVIVTQPT